MDKQKALGLFILILTAGSIYQILPLKDKVKLGLDLRGGVHLLLRAKLEALPSERNRQEAVDQVLEIIRTRVDGLGVTEPLVQVEGDDSIVVELPGFDDPKRAKDLIGKTAILEFKMVESASRLQSYGLSGLPDEKLPEDLERLPSRDKDRDALIVKKKVEMDGSQLQEAYADVDNLSRAQVAFVLKAEGAKQFARITRMHVQEQLAIVLDGVVYSAPVIQTPITGGHGVITGVGSLEEARDLALVLRSGALPVPVEISGEFVVGPTLGADSVQRGIKAGLIGMAAVFCTIVLYYRLSGVLACLAMLLNLLYLLAVMTLLGSVLTMPGIGGLILTMGMATDANVLIFERIREELEAGRTVLAAIEKGFERAMAAIIDSNVTTVITAGVLFQFGTGPIRGFAVTLFWGLIINLFTAVTCTKFFFSLRKSDQSLSI